MNISVPRWGALNKWNCGHNYCTRPWAKQCIGDSKLWKIYSKYLMRLLWYYQHFKPKFLQLKCCVPIPTYRDRYVTVYEVLNLWRKISMSLNILDPTLHQTYRVFVAKITNNTIQIYKKTNWLRVVASH